MKFLIVLTICLLFLYIILFYRYSFRKKKKKTTITEGFDLVQTTTRNNIKEIYDKFYSDVYDNLLKSDIKNEFECLVIHKDFLKKVENPKILDLGCGTGHHLKILSRYNHNLTGLDNSNSMLKKAKKNINNEKVKLVKGDFHQVKIFPKKTFDHILCLFYTIYLCKNIRLFIKNCNTWLKPQGILFIHVVNRDKFDPVLETSSSLIPFFDPQKHTDKRNTQTRLHFNKFEYISNWKFNSNYSIFSEKFKFKNKPYVRINNHRLEYHKQRYIKKIAKEEGFILVKVVDMFTIGFNYNYILCFQKKYGR